MAVFVADEQQHEVDHDDLVSLARHVLAAQRVPEEMELSVLLVDEEAIAALNQHHRGEPGATDVLAFHIDEPGDTLPDVPSVLGDVVICPAVAATQATRQGHPAAAEVRILLVHGILHLLGMDHDEPAAERAMFRLTDELLAAYGATRGSA